MISHNIQRISHTPIVPKNLIVGSDDGTLLVVELYLSRETLLLVNPLTNRQKEIPLDLLNLIRPMEDGLVWAGKPWVGTSLRSEGFGRRRIKEKVEYPSHHFRTSTVQFPKERFPFLKLGLLFLLNKNCETDSKKKGILPKQGSLYAMKSQSVLPGILQGDIDSGKKICGNEDFHAKMVRVLEAKGTIQVKLLGTKTSSWTGCKWLLHFHSHECAVTECQELAGLNVIQVSDVEPTGAWCHGYYCGDDLNDGYLMHCITRGNIGHNFLLLKEEAIYSVTNFLVQPNKEDFRVMRFADFMLEFDGDTRVRKSYVKSKGFNRYPF
ncbi:hypothetical protein Tco_0179204 [Tanacetum coccineum]